MNRQTRILIIDDYPAVRADLRTVLELVEGVEVIGEVAIGREALQLAVTGHPDIVLIDLDMDRRKNADRNDDAFISQIQTLTPHAAIYGLTTSGCETERHRDLPVGMNAVFTKGVETEKLLERVRNFKFENERKVPMQQTSGLKMNVIEQAKPTVPSLAKGNTRLAYIDSLRTALIILVIMVHAAVTYGALGSWTYVDPVTDELSAILLSFFVITCQSFFMGLFFFFAGYFTPGSYDRKGLALFWKDRLLRLGIPMIAYTWFLSKVPNYLDEVANRGMRLSFGQYFITQFWSDADEGPTWFLFALLIFSAGYTLWRLASQNADLRSWLSRLPVPTTKALLLVGLLMSVLTFAVSQVWPVGVPYDVFGIFSLLLQFFPTYILLFIAGVLAYRCDWLARLPGKTLRFWRWFSATHLVLLPVLLLLGGAPDGYLESFMGGLNWRCASFSLWLGLACISFSVTLTLWLRDRVTPNNRLAAFVGPNNFAVYLIHPLVLVPVTLGLSFFAIPALVKFGLASAFTVVLCFWLADALRRLPGMKEIL